MTQYSINNRLNTRTTTYGLLKMDLSDTNIRVLNSAHFTTDSNTYFRSDQLALDTSNTKLTLGGFRGLTNNGYSFSESTLHEFDLTSFKTTGIYKVSTIFSEISSKVNYSSNNDLLFMASDTNLTELYHLKIGKLDKLKWSECIDEITIKEIQLKTPDSIPHYITKTTSIPLRQETQSPSSLSPIIKNICSEADKTSLKESISNPFYLYPNPANKHVYVNLDIANKPIMKIYSMDGKLVYSNEDLSTGSNLIDISFIPSGIYTVRLINNLRSYTVKLIKQK